MTVQASVGGAVLGTGLGVGAARVRAVSFGGAHEQVRDSGHVAARAANELAVTGSSNTVLLLTLALMVLALGLLLRGLGRRHQAAGGSMPLAAAY